MRRSSWLVLIAVAGCGAGPPPVAPVSAQAIDDPYFSTAPDDGGAWVEQWREPLRVGGATLALVGQDWPGEGQAIAVERDGRVVGAYRFDFGGLGGTLVVARRCVAPDRVVLVVRTEGTTKPFWLSPGQGACPAGEPAAGDEDLDHDPCYVGADTDVTFVELAIDAHHVWLAGESAHAPAACPR